MQFILDKSHLKDHLYETAEAIGINQKDRRGWVEPRVRAISDGNVEAVLKELEEENDKNPNKRLKRLIGYIKRFYDALDYDNYKSEGLPNRVWRNRKCTQINSAKKVENSRCKLASRFD